MTDAAVLPPHPARFSWKIVDAIRAELLADYDGRDLLRVLDPFAGTGRVHALVEPNDEGVETVGVELEPEWAAHESRTLVGDATALPFADDSFDVLVTSPCYGNRMADAHEAKDRCKRCDGVGGSCKTCSGAGLSKRNTYRHNLGRKPSAGSASTLRWGPAYRRLHERAWAEADRVLRPGALVLVNVKNHTETVGKGDDKREIEHPVTEWHLNAWLALSAKLLAVVEITTPGQKHGANRDARADCERLLVLRTRSVTW